MGGLGTWELILIFLAILLIFGAKRIPEIARGMGQGIREFKKATNEIKQEITTADQPQIHRPSQHSMPRQEQSQTPAQTPRPHQPD